MRTGKGSNFTFKVKFWFNKVETVLKYWTKLILNMQWTNTKYISFVVQDCAKTWTIWRCSHYLQFSGVALRWNVNNVEMERLPSQFSRSSIIAHRKTSDIFCSLNVFANTVRSKKLGGSSPRELPAPITKYYNRRQSLPIKDGFWISFNWQTWTVIL